MKKILYRFGAVVGLLLLVALVIPFFVNMNSYKPLITAQAEKYLERSLSIDGNIRLSLLPSPSLNVHDVKLANIAGASDPHMVKLEKLKVKVALLPLLSKKVKVTSVLLSHPVIHFETLKNGQSNWIFEGLKEDATKNTEFTQNGSQTSPAMDLSFDDIEVIGAEVVYKTPDAQHSFQDLTASVTAESLKGPFKIDGFFKYLEQDIRFILKVKEVADNIPLKLKLDASGVDIDIEGIVAQSTQTFNGDIELKSDAKSLEALVSKATGPFIMPEFISGEMNMAGHLAASAKGLELNNLALKLEDVTIEAQCAVKFQPLTLSASAHGIPGSSTFNVNVTPQSNGQTNGHLRVSIESPRKLLNWINYKQELPEALVGLTQLEGDFIVKGDRLALKNMTFRVKDTSIHGDVSGNIKSKQFNYTVTAQGILPLAKLAGAPLIHEPGPLKLQGTTSIKDAKVNTQSTLQMAGMTLDAKGDVQLGKDLTVNMKIDANSPKAAQIFHVLLEGPAPVDRFKVSAHVAIDPKAINITDLNSQFGIASSDVTLKGSVLTQLDKERPYVTADLKTGPIKLDALFPVALDDTKVMSQEPQIVLVASKGKKVTPPPIEQKNPDERWPRRPLNLSFLEGTDGKFILICPQISRKDLSFKNLSAEGTLSNGVLEIPHIRSEFFDGKMDAAVHLNAHGTPNWTFKMTITDGNLQRFLQDTGDVKIVGGKVQANADFKSGGKSIYDWVSHLGGQFTFHIDNGSVTGFDLKSISSRIKNLTNPTALFGLLESFMSKGKTSFSTCKGTIVFTDGIGTIQNLSLDADGGQGKGDGKINLPAYQMDITGQFALSDFPELPPFRMRLYGPLDNPSKSLDTSNVQQYMIENIFSKLSGKDLIQGAGNIVESILGGGSAKKDKAPAKSDAPASSSKTNSKPSVDDVVKDPAKAIGNVLKGLF